MTGGCDAESSPVKKEALTAPRRSEAEPSREEEKCLVFDWWILFLQMAGGQCHVVRNREDVCYTAA